MHDHAQNINVAPYLNLTGINLLQMSSSDMQNIDQNSGVFVFMSLQNHMNSMGSPNPYDHTPSPERQSPYSPISSPATVS